MAVASLSTTFVPSLFLSNSLYTKIKKSRAIESRSSVVKVELWDCDGRVRDRRFNSVVVASISCGRGCLKGGRHGDRRLVRSRRRWRREGILVWRQCQWRMTSAAEELFKKRETVAVMVYVEEWGIGDSGGRGMAGVVVRYLYSLQSRRWESLLEKGLARQPFPFLIQI